MKKIGLFFLVAIMFTFAACSGNNNFLGLGEKHLTVEPVEVPVPPVNPDGTDPDVVVNDLFKLNPGKRVKLSALNGSIDPVGTNIANDFDGDGIENSKETTSNIWVSDYPEIEVCVVPPVTMKIEIEEENGQITDTIENEITSSDTTSNTDLSTESIHRNEINLRTVQYKDSFKTASSSSKEENESKNIAGSLTIKGFGANANYGKETRTSEAYSSSYGETRTKWKDQPFKDNLDRDGRTLNSNEAAKNARNLRGELKDKLTGTKRIKSNAGYIRAAMYISNNSNNMPVKMRNILCSFMLEARDGQLIPVQSFRLRNDDYSIFEIELYGGEKFGPYIVELKNLNTLEIKEAIAKGYNPKIFIIDYEMQNVTDSNYFKALPEKCKYDNLKIIEENSKGRTASVKIYGDGIREKYRVAAFKTVNCIENLNTIIQQNPNVPIEVEPGVSLEKALERISFSGTDIEFANYVIDYSGLEPEMTIIKGYDNDKKPIYYKKPQLWVRGIKSIRGKENKCPLAMTKDSDGNLVKERVDKDTNGNIIGYTYVLKPIKDWTPKEKMEFCMWVVYDAGRFYKPTADYVGEDETHEYTYVDENGISITVPKISGTHGRIWPGDHYDIVYVRMSEYLGLMNSYGTNPLETGETIALNTRWNTGDMGSNPFDPEIRSVYLGEAILGDKLEFKIKLDSTYFLNPSFGSSTSYGLTDIYTNFNYNWVKQNKKYEYDDVVDLEICYNNGNKYSDWVNINKIKDPILRNKNIVYGIKSWDFFNQVFTAEVSIPDELDGIGESDAIKIYMRTSPNNAYRESLWPKNTNIHKFEGLLVNNVVKGNNTLNIKYPAGTPEQGREIIFKNPDNSSVQYRIQSCELIGSGAQIEYKIILNTQLKEEHFKNDLAYIEYNYNENNNPGLLKICLDQNLVGNWNNIYDIYPNDYFTEQNCSLKLLDTNYNNNLYLGENISPIIANWIGYHNYGNSFVNNWSDSLNFNLFKYTNYQLAAVPCKGALSIYRNNIYYNNSETKVSNSESDTIAENEFFYKYENKVLLVWSGVINNDKNIYARVFDISTNTWGDIFTVNTYKTGEQAFPGYVAKDNKVLLSWQSVDVENCNNIKGRLYDLTSNSWINFAGSTDEFLINTYTNRAQHSAIGNVSSNSLGIITWLSSDLLDKDYWDIRARIFNFNTMNWQSVQGSSNDFLIPINNDSSPLSNKWFQDSFKVNVINNYIIWFWNSNDTAANETIANSGESCVWYIKSRVFNIDTGNWVSSWISTRPNGWQHEFNIININNEFMFLSWAGDGAESNIIGQMLYLDPLTSNLSQVGQIQTTSTSNVNIQRKPKLYYNNNKLLITWESNHYGDWDLFGRFYNVSGFLLKPINVDSDGNDFLINSFTANSQLACSGLFKNNKLIFLWSGYNNLGTGMEMVSRIFDFDKEMFLGYEETINLNINGDQGYHDFVNIGDNMFLSVWQNSYSKRHLYTRIFNVPDEIIGGPNNFIVSPLIERNFSVSTRIIESR